MPRGIAQQWPFAIKLYKDDGGKIKGDGTVTYEDPSAAQAAPEFFNGDTPSVYLHCEGLNLFTVYDSVGKTRATKQQLHHRAVTIS